MPTTSKLVQARLGRAGGDRAPSKAQHLHGTQSPVGLIGLSVLAAVAAGLRLTFAYLWNLGPTDEHFQTGVAIAILLFALVIWFLRANRSPTTLIICSILLIFLFGISSSVTDARVDALATGFFYVWLAAYLSFAVQRRVGLALVGLSSVSYLLGLISSHVRQPMAPWILVTVTSFAIYFEMSRLRLATDRLIETDHLTGLMNRRGFMAVADRELARASRGGPGFTLAIVDLDHFKDLNDSKGHLAGDALLKEVAKVWLENMRATDYLFRIGGDEFVFLFDNTNRPTSSLLADRIMSKTPWKFSVGISPSRQGDDINTILRLADEALYEAKRRGGGQIVWAESRT